MYISLLHMYTDLCMRIKDVTRKIDTFKVNKNLVLRCFFFSAN